MAGMAAPVFFNASVFLLLPDLKLSSTVRPDAASVFGLCAHYLTPRRPTRTMWVPSAFTTDNPWNQPHGLTGSTCVALFCMPNWTTPTKEDIAAIRKDAGLTQRELSVLLDIPERQVGRWETGVSKMHHLVWNTVQAKLKEAIHMRGAKYVGWGR